MISELNLYGRVAVDYQPTVSIACTVEDEEYDVSDICTSSAHDIFSS